MAANNTQHEVFSKSMELEEALEDSPMFRKKTKNAENTVDEFASAIKKVLKSMKHYQASARDQQESFNDFISEVVTLKNTMGVPDDTIDKGYTRLVGGLKDIAHFQDLLAQQMDGLISPLQDFINNDVKIVKDHTKKYEKATSHLDSVLSKLGQVKKKNSQKVEELESELAGARKAHTGASLDVALTMNEILAKKRFEFLERMGVYMHAQMTYFHQGYECFKDLEPSMQSYASHLQATRSVFECERKKSQERRVALEANPAVAKSPTQQLSQTVKRGYLFKRSAEDMINSWSKRYFVLQDNQLCAYKNGKDQQPDLVLQLLLYTVKSREDLDRRNCFELVSPPDKSVLLQAENEESKQEWIQAIQGCISNLLNAQPSHDEKHTRKTASSLDGANENRAACAELKQLNPTCADCDSKDPEWASINFGVLLCIDCSGVHRSMGVHISKVRSLTLDAWDSDQLEVSLKLGNKKVNEIYEAQIPADRQKPGSGASWDVRQKWIRDKYEGKKFVKPSYSFPVEMHAQLAEAVTNDDAASILRLYAQGIDLNYQDPTNNKRTPLHLAVSANRPAIVLLMLLNAADPSLKDDQGWTPLHLAADLGLANCAIPLLQKNSVHILAFTDKNNHTPLDIAVSNGGADCVTLFRLAQLAREESGNVSYEESFAQALRMFTKDARTKPS